jgi:hypothetical protein
LWDLLSIVHLAFLGLHPDTVDCEVGAQDLAEVTVDTLLRFDHLGRVIPLGIEFVREFQNALGAVFNAVTATLAAFLYDMQLTSGYLELVDIERRSPECHGKLQLLVYVFL